MAMPSCHPTWNEEMILTHDFHKETDTALFTHNKHWKDPTVLELKRHSPPIQSNAAQQFKGGKNKK